MKIIDTEIIDVKILKPAVFYDNRGCFFEGYNMKVFADSGVNLEFFQDNVSISTKGVIRGMHGQFSPSQAKLVRCLSGKILDVAIDIRPESPTFKKWVSVVLSDEDFSALLIPHGFLHGFAALSERVIVSYKTTGVYDKSSEYGVNPLSCGIDWQMTSSDIKISERDLSAPALDEFLDSERFTKIISKTF